ncbi:4a-hydroxytetrahydrobiopterin dehydratase [Edaphobacter modestus]|uniref:Putative pterin-4-alpha-carbinolamine dehydratase n=1 Tax=Edaphobacter modestus TaxID=388466 RepID=A0A4Q7YRH6_9BACT|nr:4a-hydroxytetrahydrobiopterin dehydratase [Edaphobacter modestus]RZU39774.1 4a-hydroxytetrahydrobiopterin dehydratase [Edaphobacter modestus]
MAILNQAEIDSRLKENPDWKLDSGKLVRDWTFKDFVQAIAFVNQVAELAEAAGHHPDIEIRYNRVRLALVSHDAGGITIRDTKMMVRLTEALS